MKKFLVNAIGNKMNWLANVFKSDDENVDSDFIRNEIEKLIEGAVNKVEEKMMHDVDDESANSDVITIVETEKKIDGAITKMERKMRHDVDDKSANSDVITIVETEKKIDGDMTKMERKMLHDVDDESENSDFITIVEIEKLVDGAMTKIEQKMVHLPVYAEALRELRDKKEFIKSLEAQKRQLQRVIAKFDFYLNDPRCAELRSKFWMVKVEKDVEGEKVETVETYVDFALYEEQLSIYKAQKITNRQLKAKLKELKTKQRKQNLKLVKRNHH